MTIFLTGCLTVDRAQTLLRLIMILPKQERTTKSQNKKKNNKKPKKRRIKRNSGNITNQRTAATASKEKLHEWHLTCQTGDGAESWMGTGYRVQRAGAGDGTETEWKLLQLQF